MIYNESLQKSLVSFLQEAPRFYSEENEIIKKAGGWNSFIDSYNLIFLVFVRLSTHKESKG